MRIYHITNVILPHILDGSVLPISYIANGLRHLASMPSYPSRFPGHPRRRWPGGFVVPLLAAIPAALGSAHAAPVAAKGDAANGRDYFEQRCTGCHSITQNSFGPRLGDVYGRRVASVAGFRYS
jgi:mono/diheme cytochrome c family protein